MTNYEKIMSEMTIDKMADDIDTLNRLVCETCPVKECEFIKSCKEYIREWLESEADTE